MSLPKSDTSSHSSSDDHYSDGTCEYEYEEEIAAVAETDLTLTKTQGLINSIYSGMKHLLQHTKRKSSRWAKENNN